MYLYSSHVGGLYFSENILELEYCEQCGDCDEFLGLIRKEEDIETMGKGSFYCDWVIEDAIERWRIINEKL